MKTVRLKEKIQNNASSAYPVQERKQNNLQFVPHILIIYLKIVLGIREIPSYLLDINTKLDNKNERSQKTKQKKYA